MLLEGSYMEISFGSKTSIGVIELTVNAAALADHLTQMEPGSLGISI